MIKTIKGLKVFYEQFEGKGTPVLLLHGWGGSSISVKGIFNHLKQKGHSVISLDFPGFGVSDFPPDHFGLYDYAQLVREFLNDLGINNVVILGHSFGGKVGLVLAAATNLAEKLILVDASGIKPKRTLKYRIKVLTFKLRKKFGLSTIHAGSSDYRALDGGLKNVFVRIVNTHLNSILCEVNCPTLIVWGARDKDTPMYMAKKLEKGIADSGLVVFKNGGHYSYVDCFNEFCLVLDNFVK